MCQFPVFIKKYIIMLLMVTSIITNAAPQPESYYFNILRDIININSHTLNPEGSVQVQNRIIPEFVALGFAAERLPANNGHSVLKFSVPGSAPSIALLGHIDTVFSQDHPFQTFSQTDTTIYGPGAIDMKSGVVLILNLLAHLDKAQLDSFVVLINDDEEHGSPDTTKLLLEESSKVDTVLIFEPGLSDGAVVIGHPGGYRVELKSQGRAAHAGLEPEKGINACADLIFHLQNLLKLANPQKGNLINIGKLQGGLDYNIICPDAYAYVELRYRDQETFSKFKDYINTITQEKNGHAAKISQKVVMDISMMSEEATSNVFAQLKQTGNEINISVTGQFVGYGSDGNNIAQLVGVNVIVGLGPYGGGMHTSEEFMLKEAYRKRLQLNLAFLKKLLANRG